MSYINKWCIKINRPPIILLMKLLISNIWLDIIAVIILLVDYLDMRTNWHTGFGTEEYFFLLILLFQLLMIIIIVVKWIHRYYIFGDNKLTYHSWVIFKKKQEFVLDKIWSTNFEQSILWKIFNYWDILIYIQNEKFKLRLIPDPEEFILFLSKKDK